jgi:hypothetical protein
LALPVWAGALRPPVSVPCPSGSSSSIQKGCGPRGSSVSGSKLMPPSAYWRDCTTVRLMTCPALATD